LQFTYEGGSLESMRNEAVQVGAMALRFLLNVGSVESRPSKQVERRKTTANRPSPKC
jgi:hypothetical protein